MKTRVHQALMIDVNLRKLIMERAKAEGKTFSTLVNEILWAYIAQPTKEEQEIIEKNPALKALLNQLF